jgi:hypothetical protein
MWNFITQPGVAAAAVDFTHDLSWLLTGLVGVVWFSAGMLAYVAIQHYVSQRITLPADRAPAAVDCQDAA